MNSSIVLIKQGMAHAKRGNELIEAGVAQAHTFMDKVESHQGVRVNALLTRIAAHVNELNDIARSVEVVCE